MPSLNMMYQVLPVHIKHNKTTWIRKTTSIGLVSIGHKHFNTYNLTILSLDFGEAKPRYNQYFK